MLVPPSFLSSPSPADTCPTGWRMQGSNPSPRVASIPHLTLAAVEDRAPRSGSRISTSSREASPQSLTACGWVHSVQSGCVRVCCHIARSHAAARVLSNFAPVVGCRRSTRTAIPKRAASGTLWARAKQWEVASTPRGGIRQTQLVSRAQVCPAIACACPAQLSQQPLSC